MPRTRSSPYTHPHPYNTEEMQKNHEAIISENGFEHNNKKKNIEI
jgi:hypothetical protein